MTRMLPVVCIAVLSWVTGAAAQIDVRRHGAAGDGLTKDTAAIQAAIDSAARAGGGVVTLSGGRFLSGTVLLRSGVTLRIEAGAALLASTDPADYPPHRPGVQSYTENYVCQSLIHAEGQEMIGVEGGGTIDVRGDAPAWRAQSPDTGYRRRPYLVRFVASSDVRVHGLTMLDSPMWTQHYLACERVRIEGLTVRGHVNNNNDMLDVDSCRDVIVTGCFGDTSDDAITLKATTTRPCENVVISNCVVSSHCNAIKCGTESNGGFRNIAISNCVVRPTRHVPAHSRRQPGIGGLSLELVDGGTMENVSVSNLAIEGTIAPIFLRLANRARPIAEGQPKPGPGRMRNITITGVTAMGASEQGSSITGLPGQCIENLVLRDIRIETAGGGTTQDAQRTIAEKPEEYPEPTMFGRLPASGLFIRHVDGLRIEGLDLRTVQPDARPPLVLEDVRRLVQSPAAQSRPGES